MNSCLENIIGISDTAHPCFSDEFSAEARISKSGKYMTQLPEFPSLEVFQSMAIADQTTLEAKLTEARTNAISEFKETLNRELAMRYTIKSQSFVGSVGNAGNNSTLEIAYGLAGCVYDMKQYQGATIVVKSVIPYFNYTGTVEVRVYRAYTAGTKYQIIELVKTFTVNTHITAPVSQAVSSLELATTDEVGKAYSYLFIYTKVEGQAPKDNAASCGCGDKETILNHYMKPYGIVGNDIDNMLLSSRSTKINGLLFAIEARCTGGDFICDNYYDNEFIRESIEWQILRKSGANAIKAILNCDLVNRYTMAKREQMGNAAHILNSIFKKNVAWIAENMNMSNNDCFSCNPGGNGGTYTIQRDGILL